MPSFLRHPSPPSAQSPTPTSLPRDPSIQSWQLLPAAPPGPLLSEGPGNTDPPLPAACVWVLIPSSGKQAQTHAGAAGSSTENHSCPPQSNPGEEVASWGPKHLPSPRHARPPALFSHLWPRSVPSRLPLCRRTAARPLPLPPLQLARPDPQLRPLRTLPRVEKLSWKRKERISTRSMPRL